MLYIIDGTGHHNDEVYLTQMAGGFCQRMRDKFNGQYVRGPTRKDYTISTESIANEVYSKILHNPQLKRQPLFLAGHSRGGAAVIRVSQDLKKRGHTVDAMFLFDAVDRTGPLQRSVQRIPSNVRAAYHATRDTIIGSYFDWAAKNAIRQYNQCTVNHAGDSRGIRTACEKERELAIKYQRLDDAMKLRVRANFSWDTGAGLLEGLSIPFGNCGTEIEDARLTKLDTATFLGSHGAMGGSPIGAQDKAWGDEDKLKFLTIMQADRAAMASVWAWMSRKFDEAQLQLHGGVQSQISR